MTSAIREFTRGYFTQLHVIHALILRETRTRFGNYSLGYIWALLEPMVGVGMFMAMFYLTDRIAPAGTDSVGFLCTGFLPYGIFSGAMNKAKTAVQSNLALLYYPQVHTLDLVAARCLLETVTVGIAFFLFMLLNSIYQQHFPMDSALKTLLGLGLAALLGTGIGLVFNSICVVFPTFDHFVGPLMRPLFWISGLFFSAHEVPAPVRELFLLNPVLHIVEITRDGWFQSYNYEYYSYSYVAYWILGVLSIGLLSEKMTRKYVLAG